ncbi:MAG: hypothetical protein QXK89_03635 [Candidatus Bathyarchaeia archaeon]
MKGKLLLHLFLVLLPVIIKLALMQYPYIVNANVKIVSAEIVGDGLILRLTGTIMINPAKIPTEKEKNWYNLPEFLDWWENGTNIENVINNEIKKHCGGLINLYVEVEEIDLWWVRRDKGKLDVIGFDVTVKASLTACTDLDSLI